MQKITSTSSFSSIPAPTSSGTPGYFHGGDLGLSIAPTQLTADWFNCVQNEILNVTTELNEPESLTDNTQMVRAVKNMRASNLLINGDMSIWQRGQSGWIAAPHQQYLADRWCYLNDSLSVASIAADLDTPSHTYSGTTLPFSLLYTTTTINTPSAAHSSMITQHIEGTTYGKYIKSTLTYSFFIKSSRTGRFAVAFQNHNKTQSYVATYQISAINAWEKVSITVPRPTTGSWLTDNGIGISVNHVLCAGSSRQTTEGSWVAGNFLSTSSCNNFTDSTAIVKITGCQLEMGSHASAFIATDPTLEFLKCQRYFQTNYATAQDYGQFTSADVTSGRTYRRGYQLTVPMRDIPTIVLDNVNDQSFPPVSGTVTGITPSSFIESRVADTTDVGAFYSKFTATAELLYV